jgi:hypothetical protein
LLGRHQRQLARLAHGLSADPALSRSGALAMLAVRTYLWGAYLRVVMMRSRRPDLRSLQTGAATRRGSCAGLR